MISTRSLPGCVIKSEKASMIYQFFASPVCRRKVYFLRHRIQQGINIFSYISDEDGFDGMTKLSSALIELKGSIRLHSGGNL